MYYYFPLIVPDLLVALHSGLKGLCVFLDYQFD
jgi:hypothetical protein